jgi:hypothetical protein
MDQDQQFVPVANSGIGSMFVRFVKMISKAVLREAKNFISHKRIGAHWI